MVLTLLEIDAVENESAEEIFESIVSTFDVALKDTAIPRTVFPNIITVLSASTNMKSKNTPSLTTEPINRPSQLGAITQLPNELLTFIFAGLDRCTSASLGVTCRRLYDVHFRVNGQTLLNERTTRKIAIGFNKEPAYFLRDLLAEWMGRDYEYCFKRLIFVRRGAAWSTWNWVSREKGSEAYEIVMERYKKQEQLYARHQKEDEKQNKGDLAVRSWRKTQGRGRG